MSYSLHSYIIAYIYERFKSFLKFVCIIFCRFFVNIIQKSRNRALSHNDPLDTVSLSAFFVKADDNAAEETVPLSLLEFGRHTKTQSVYGRFQLYAETGTLDARHACVGNVRRMTSENRFVGGLHMSVSTENSRDLACEIMSHRLFFGRCFGVKVHKNIGRMNIAQQLVSLCKRVIQRVHIDRTHKVYHSHGEATHIENANALSVGCSVGIICRSDNAVGGIENGIYLLTPENMVARCNNIRARIDERIRRSRGNAVSLSRIFAVYHSNINGELLFDVPELRAEKAAPCLSHDIAYK